MKNKKELLKKLLGKIQPEGDIDGAQDARWDIEKAATAVVKEAGIPDEDGALAEELAGAINYVPEHFEIAK
jgi:hypothetical protein